MRIETGSRDDYERLRFAHYLPGPPATPVRYLRAVRSGRLAGVLVVAMPTLNGSWREIAWGRPSQRDRSARAHELNRTLRTIARVIVDPRLRGLGVATALVRAYLKAPLTERTEAVATMGAVCPFFVRAGMTEAPVPVHPADARLADALDAAGIDAWQLPAWADRDPFVARELGRWKRNRGAAVTRVPDARLASEATRRLLARPRAYVAEAA